MVWGDHCPHYERYFTHIPNIAFSVPVISLIDIVTEFMDHQGKEFNGSERYYDVNLMVQIYSLILIIIIYRLLLHFNIAQVKSNFHTLWVKFYSKSYFWSGFVILLLVNILFYRQPEKAMSSKTFSEENLAVVLIYLALFFTVLYIASNKYFHLKTNMKKVLWLLVFVFPVVSVSDEYRYIPLCGSEGHNYERVITLLPLVNAIPKTVISVFQDLNREQFEFSVISVVKGYTIIQALLMLFFFPTLLNVNEETNARFL